MTLVGVALGHWVDRRRSGFSRVTVGQARLITSIHWVLVTISLGTELEVIKAMTCTISHWP
jgi:hypothetical protein